MTSGARRRQPARATTRCERWAGLSTKISLQSSQR